MTVEEQLAAAKAENEKLAASIEKLTAQNTKVIEEKRKAAADALAAQEAAEEAATAAAAKTGDVEAVKAAAAKDLKKAQDALAAVIAERDTAILETSIKTTLTENGIAPAYHKALTAQIKAEAKIADGKVIIGDADLSSYMTGFVASDEGKHFVAATANSGAGATGSKAMGSAMTKDNFSLTKFMEIAAKNPAEANALADSLGMPELKTT